MKDLGTVPLLAYALPNVVAFYPDGAWWIPCVMEMNAGLLSIADSLGVDESFCPVRAMLGAFVTEGHFPIPDLLVSSVGATCDDFSAVAQRLEGLGHPVLWWEMPHRRRPEPGEAFVTLPGGFKASVSQVRFVRDELARVAETLGALAGRNIGEALLSRSIEHSNRVRGVLTRLRETVFMASVCPLPALEMLVAEMFALHYCSGMDEVLRVLQDCLREVEGRVSTGAGHFGPDAVRVFWVNPVADIRIMNELEEAGGRVCGTDYMFAHSLDPIPTDVDPLEALARTALADPMVGRTQDRAQRVCEDASRFGAEAVVISRIPGASHCAFEGRVIGDSIRERLDLPVLEIEVPPLSDADGPAIRTRLEALMETARESREGKSRR